MHAYLLIALSLLPLCPSSRIALLRTWVNSWNSNLNPLDFVNPTLFSEIHTNVVKLRNLQSFLLYSCRVGWGCGYGESEVRLWLRWEWGEAVVTVRVGWGCGYGDSGVRLWLRCRVGWGCGYGESGVRIYTFPSSMLDVSVWTAPRYGTSVPHKQTSVAIRYKARYATERSEFRGEKKNVTPF